MQQTKEEISQNLAERWCWEVARRDDARVARRLYRQQVVDGVYRLDEGAVLDDFLHFLDALGVMRLLADIHGTAIPRELGPFVQYVLLYGLKPLFGSERIKALPPLLFSDEALMPLMGFNAQQVRQGICQRGATTRQGERPPGPICPDTLATNIVKLNGRELAAVCNGVIRAVARAGGLGATVTGLADGTDWQTPERSPGCGQVTRQVRLEEKRGPEHDIDVTVDGWKVLILSDVVTKIPRAVQVVNMHEHEALWTRALVTQARIHLGSAARLHKVVCDQGFVDGTALWWLDHHDLIFVVPAKAKMAVTAAARAQTAAGEEVTVGRRVHTVRHGQGKTAWTERLETEGVGLAGLTTDDQDGTAEHGRRHNRRDCQPNPSNAVVVRQWRGKDYGPGGKTVFLSHASRRQPWKPFDDDTDRRLIETCGLEEAKQQWQLGHPPPQTERAVRVHVLFTLRMFALATADRRRCEPEAMGGAPVGWQRWRRQLLEQTRAKVIVCAEGHDGIFHRAEYALLLGVKRTDVPAGIGSRQEVLAKYRLTVRG
jgi:hypothetical protein